MSQVHYLKDGICLALGTVGAFVSAFFGGWDAAMTTLMIFMIIDYLTGMIVAGVFHHGRLLFDHGGGSRPDAPGAGLQGPADSERHSE